jgi:hypothetical protein
VTTDTAVLTTVALREAVEASRELRVVSRPSWPKFAATFGVLFESARAPLSMPLTRWYFFEELFFGTITGVIGGWEPLDQRSCRVTGVLLVVAAVLHLGFLLYSRPYATWLDFGFAFANGVGVAAAAACAVAAVGADVMDRLALLQIGLFIVQPVALLVHAGAVKLKQRRAARQALAHQKSAALQGLTNPLLVVPQPRP